MLLLLLYGLTVDWEPRIDCNPRILPRLRVVSRSGGPPRKLRLRMSVVPGLNDVDERVTLVLRGCNICWLLTALYISCGEGDFNKPRLGYMHNKIP